MYKVLIVSDSHGLTKELDEIKKRHHVPYQIHCGDSELHESNPQLTGFTVVKGNCDWNGNFPNEKILEIGGLRFFITHGHLYGVKRTLLQLHYRAQELEADVVCYGHSHIAYADKLGEQLFINPGSIRTPQKYNEPSYVILKWDDSKEINAQFYDLSGKIITKFPHSTIF